MSESILFTNYYKTWMETYKKGAVRDVTYKKYLNALTWIEKIIPNLKTCDLNRQEYQKLINKYAEEHEKVTVCDFHHHLKSAILDAVDEGLINSDPTRRVVIKGKPPKKKKIKYLNQYELHELLIDLNLEDEINFDWLIYLIAKTGMRFSEALGLTPDDFDFSKQTISVNKTWNYKSGGGFVGTKNNSSIRKIQVDWQTMSQFSNLIKGIPESKPIFVSEGQQIYNSTVNAQLEKHCRNANVPIIGIHGLRHTHASLLLFSGVSIASVAMRLGHSDITTTQKTYIHIIKEMENKDNDLVMRSMAGLI